MSSSGFSETSFGNDDFFEARKPRDPFGKDLDLFQINVRNAADIKRYQDLNPMLSVTGELA